MSIGAGLEGASHSHARRALEMGITPTEIKHVVLLANDNAWVPKYRGVVKKEDAGKMEG